MRKDDFQRHGRGEEMIFQENILRYTVLHRLSIKGQLSSETMKSDPS